MSFPLLTRAALALGFAAVAPAGPVAAAEPVEGQWSTGSGGGRVLICLCGQQLCGKVVDATLLRSNPDYRDLNNPDARLRTRRLMGLVILSGFSGGPDLWKGGPLYDPESGSGAKSGTLRLRPDGKLEVKGCIAVFCRTKVWTRAR